MSHSISQGNTKDANLEIQRLREELSKAKNDLNEFISLASHDLIAPLNAIDNLTDWLAEDIGLQISEESLTHLTMMKGRTKRAKLLIKDLLLYSRVGNEAEEYEHIDFKQTITECASQTHANTFQLDIDGCDLMLPKQSFITVLMQLLSNIVKHHTSDTGEISVKCQKLTDAYQIEVKDDGPGIEPQNHEIVFKKFKTLKSRDEVEGSGMGLAIVEKILSQYAAKIRLVSDGKSGSTFIIEWPFAPKSRVKT